ncbi:MAG: ester cyclase [Dehalococcoidia bacterium]
MTPDPARTAFERWYGAALAGQDLLGAVHGICAPDCVIHMQNGEDGDRAATETQTSQARALYPDLAIEIDDVITTGHRMLVQVSVTGTPSLVFRIARGRKVFGAIGAVVADVNDRAEIIELWAYLNPGAMLTFPPASRPPLPPEPDDAPGTEEDAAAVLAQWKRARTGSEFLDAVLATATRDCLVHATNTEVGTTALLESQMHVVQAAFPDLTVEFSEGFTVGDRLVAQFTFDGTQRGWLGIAPPSGSRVQSTGAIVARVPAERRVQEMWVYLAPGIGLFFPRKR